LTSGDWRTSFHPTTVSRSNHATAAVARSSLSIADENSRQSREESSHEEKPRMKDSGDEVQRKKSLRERENPNLNFWLCISCYE
jgi:hypothetical protein